MNLASENGGITMFAAVQTAEPAACAVIGIVTSPLNNVRLRWLRSICACVDWSRSTPRMQLYDRSRATRHSWSIFIPANLSSTRTLPIRGKLAELAVSNLHLLETKGCLGLRRLYKASLIRVTEEPESTRAVVFRDEMYREIRLPGTWPVRGFPALLATGLRA